MTISNLLSKLSSFTHIQIFHGYREVLSFYANDENGVDSTWLDHEIDELAVAMDGTLIITVR